MSSKPVLIIQHAPYEHASTLLRSLKTQGVRTKLLRPYLKEPYPRLKSIAGVISLGGPMSANDNQEHPWIRTESKLLKDSVEALMPTVGICLGAQMLAKALGGFVERNERIELGWLPITLNQAGKSDPILSVAGGAPTVYQWHEDTFHLPPGATLLAKSKACARQAYRVHECAYGFQFHPEADRQLIQSWLDVDGVAEEILKIRKNSGPKTVQTALLQRKNAIQAEISSIKIATAISALFRANQHEKKLSEERSGKIKKSFRASQKIALGWIDAHGKSAWLSGKIKEKFKALDEEYWVLKEADGTLWPVCLSDVTEFKLL